MLLAKHYDITFAISKRKTDLCDLMIESLVDENIFDQSVLKPVDSSLAGVDTSELIKKIGLELQAEAVQSQAQSNAEAVQNEAQRTHELQIKTLELASRESSKNNFDVTKHIRLVSI